MYHDSDADCLWLDVVDEGIRLVMLFVCRVLLTRSLLPPTVLGEEGVGVGGRVVNLGKAESVGYGERLLVDACSTYYIYILIFRAVCQCFVE